MQGLKGKNVLITGSATGIGQATAIRFASEGANVAINYHGQVNDAKETQAAVAKLSDCAKAAGCQYFIVKADISDKRSVEEMFKKVLEKWDRIDILINNAGIQKEAASDKIKMSDFDEVIDINLRGTFLCCKAILTHFLSRPGGGVILNNSSVHEVIPKPEFLSYSISKGGLRNLTTTLALEYASKGIRVNSVGPGAILTPINPWRNDKKAKAEVEKHIPLGRAGEPEEIAAVFAFLASDEASYITGQTIFADGGLTLYPEFRNSWSS
jgi:glucose 1-dehydrogenase